LSIWARPDFTSKVPNTGEVGCSRIGCAAARCIGTRKLGFCFAAFFFAMNFAINTEFNNAGGI